MHQGWRMGRGRTLSGQQTDQSIVRGEHCHLTSHWDWYPAVQQIWHTRHCFWSHEGPTVGAIRANNGKKRSRLIGTSMTIQTIYSFSGSTPLWTGPCLFIQFDLQSVQYPSFSVLILPSYPFIPPLSFPDHILLNSPWRHSLIPYCSLHLNSIFAWSSIHWVVAPTAISRTMVLLDYRSQILRVLCILAPVHISQREHL